MTVEELLKPRYKVIADYPNSSFTINEIVYADNFGKFTQYEDYGTWQLRPEFYPAVFKKLKWWEDRKESDMPDYVKQFNTGIVEKVKSYTGCCSIVEFFDNTEGHISFWHPATEEEYLNQNKTTL